MQPRTLSGSEREQIIGIVKTIREELRLVLLTPIVDNLAVENIKEACDGIDLIVAFPRRESVK